MSFSRRDFVKTSVLGAVAAGVGTRAQGEDAKPAAAEHDASVVLKQWDEMKVSDLPAINAQLRSAHLPELKLEVHSDPGMGEGDEE